MDDAQSISSAKEHNPPFRSIYSPALGDSRLDNKIAGQSWWNLKALTTISWTHILRYHWVGLATVSILSLALLLLGLLQFDSLSWKAWFTFGVVVLSLGLLVESLVPTHMVFLGSGAAFMAFDIITVKEGLAGFSNEGIATVAILFVVAKGVQQTNVLNVVFRILLGRPKNFRVALLRMLAPCVLLSSFLNNTPIVAMMIPVIMRWSEYNNVSPRRLLMPMTIGVTLAAQNTLIGTSTNLVVTGLVDTKRLKDLDGNLISVSIFEQTKAGVIYCLVGVLYLLIVSPIALKDPKEADDLEKKGAAVAHDEYHGRKEYAVAFQITPKYPSHGKVSLKESGFQTESVRAIRLTRKDGVLSDPKADAIVEAGDIILVVGSLSALLTLYKMDGVQVATTSSHLLPLPKHRRALHEVVLGPGFVEPGVSFAESKWERYYSGALVGAYYRASGSLEDGDILSNTPLEAGTTVLVEGARDFSKTYGDTQDFTVIRRIEDSESFRTDLLQMLLSSALAVTAIVLAACEVTSLFISASVAALLMIVFGCLTLDQAARSIDVPVVLTVASTFALSTAMDKTGAAAELSKQLVTLFSPWGNYGVLFGIYVSTSLLTQIITNNGAAALMFPIALAPNKGVAYLEGVNPYAAIFIVMFGASSCFSTPFGYQCNMMVHTPGKYSFTDWPRHSVGLQIILALLAPLICNYFWPSP